MENNDIIDSGVSGSKLSAKEAVFKYLAYLPLFIVSLIIFLGTAILYIRYKQPLYKASVKVFVKGEERGSNRANDVVEVALSGGKRVNLDNEIELMRSEALVDRVVRSNRFNINYYFKGKIKVSAIYKDAPFELVATKVNDSLKAYSFLVSNITSTGGTVSSGEKDKGKPFTWNQEINGGGIRFTLNRNFISIPAKDAVYQVKWSPVAATVGEILSKVTIAALNAKTTILQLTITLENVERAKDILNALVKEYNASGIEEKNKVAQNTIRFINERLNLVTGELSGVESNLESYRGSNQAIDVAAQSQMYFDNANEVQNSLQKINIQQKVTQMLFDYVSQPANNNRTVPSNLGIDDVTLAALIARYNELQLRKERETPLVTGNSLVLEDINNQLEGTRNSIVESLRNIIKNLQLQASELRARAGQNQALLSSVPRKERVLKGIIRQQGVQEGLYLYLLQKREETAISSASTVSNYAQINPAGGSTIPVEPNTTNIKLVAVLLGILVPLGYIFLRDLLNDKVTQRSDIIKATDIPIIGEIAHNKSRDRKLVVGTNDRSILAEQFRMIRTNVRFITKNNPRPVLMVTSTMPGEGKTFCSMNLAAVLAVTGKKTAVLELDLRKPKISTALKLQGIQGISTYVMGMCKAEDLAVPIEGTENLFLIPAGPIPPNPAELLLDERMDDLFAYLKQNFDCIIIDTAPMGLVSDAKILGKYADATIYVVRQQYTFKKQLAYIHEQYLGDVLPNMSLLVNDVKVGGVYSYYGYGYGYGYGYSYNYDSNYTYGDDTKKSTWAKMRERVNF